MGTQMVAANFGDWRVTSWLNYRTRYTLPYSGGFLDQPLGWLILCQVLDLTAETYTGRHTEHFKLNKLTPLQLALFTWLEKDDETPDG